MRSVASVCTDRVRDRHGRGPRHRAGPRARARTAGRAVVVNDLGSSVDGTGTDRGPAQTVVEEIHAAGGEAIANGDDVSTWAGAKALVTTAIETFGGLDVVVNNAGILRDRMLVNMTEEEWDAVIRVHLKGTFGPTHFAAAYWRERAKAGEPVDARVINTSSTSGLFANPGQTNYGAAKSGIATFSIIAAKELGRYGVTVNAIAPGALTRMTENLSGARPAPTGDAWSAARPRTSRRSWRGWRAPSRPVSPARSSSSPAGASASRRAGSGARASITAHDGTRRSSAPSCPSSSPMRRAERVRSGRPVPVDCERSGAGQAGHDRGDDVDRRSLKTKYERSQRSRRSRSVSQIWSSFPMSTYGLARTVSAVSSSAGSGGSASAMARAVPSRSSVTTTNGTTICISIWS